MVTVVCSCSVGDRKEKGELSSLKRDGRGMKEDTRDFITDRGTRPAQLSVVGTPPREAINPTGLNQSIRSCNAYSARPIRAPLIDSDAAVGACPKFGAGPSKRYQIL